jgi:hypothetical protein
MNATSGTMQLPVATRHAGAVREIGSSALDRSSTAWAPPDPATIVVDPWGPPRMLGPIASQVVSPWPAPLASSRVDAPIGRAVSIDIVEPLHAVQTPDLGAIARRQARQRLLATRSLPAAVAPGPVRLAPPVPIARVPIAPLDGYRPGLPAPTQDQLVRSDEEARVLAGRHHDDRSGVSAWLLAAVVLGVGAWCAAAFAVFTLF